jgi:hypothetical protein
VGEARDSIQLVGSGLACAGTVHVRLDEAAMSCLLGHVLATPL